MTTARSALRVVIAHAAYALVVHLACLLAVPPWLVRVGRDRRQIAWTRQRFGRLPPGRPEGAPIWIHAVSVGEVKASRALVDALHARAPEVPLVLSTGTLAGFDTARRLFPERYVFPLPLDLPWVVRSVVRRVAPRLLILLELEVWPALLRAADEAGVPQALVNARVSESSFRTYRLLRWWLPEFDRLRCVAAQDDRHAARIAALGVPRERMRVTGNLKHDLAAEPPAEAVEALRAALRLTGPPPIFVAGSTHDGEDAPVVRAWLAAGGGRAAQLVLVPRHLDRVREITRLLQRLGVGWVLRSQAGTERDPGRVLVVDTLGELELLFRLGDVVFLGGSLVPVGGHNVLEPAAAGRPILVGPHLESCRREAEVLRRAGALLVVSDEQTLARDLASLLADPGARRRMGLAARDACRSLEGAAAADLALLAEHGLLAGALLKEPWKSATLRRPSAGGSPASSPRTGASLP